MKSETKKLYLTRDADGTANPSQRTDCASFVKTNFIWCSYTMNDKL